MAFVLVPRLAALALQLGAATPGPSAERPPAAARAPAEEALSPLASRVVLAALGPFVPEVGAWVEYLVRPRGIAKSHPDAKGPSDRARVRLSVLPPAQADGRYWLELASATSAGLAVATRVLFHGDPAAPRSIERIIVFVAGQAAFELPVAEAREPLDASEDPAPGPARVRRLGSGPVRVAAGSFLADRLRVVSGGEVTLVHRAAEVPFWGLVRAEGPQGSVELLGFSHQGAHSVVPLPQGNGNESTK